MHKCLLLIVGTVLLLSCNQDTDSTEIIIQNNSERDSVKVYLTLPSTESAEGHFGITKDHLTPSNPSQGYFWALKDSSYSSNNNGKVFEGFAISFDTTNIPCTGASGTKFISGVNVFEGSLNVEYESFDISCMDGVNAVLQVTVSDSINWTTGDGTNILPFTTSTNSAILKDNYNIRGVFPYRCTDCIDTPNPPSNCYNLPLTCSSERTCQANRAKHQGGKIFLTYLGEARDSTVINQQP